MLFPYKMVERNSEIYLHQKLILPLYSLCQRRVWSLTQSSDLETGKLFKEIPVFHYSLDSIHTAWLVDGTSQIFLNMSYPPLQLHSFHSFQPLWFGLPLKSSSVFMLCHLYLPWEWSLWNILLMPFLFISHCIVISWVQISLSYWTMNRSGQFLSLI